MNVEIIIGEFVPCNVLNSKCIHDPDDCQNCMEIYDELKGDIMEEFAYRHTPKGEYFSTREIVDIMEVSQESEEFDDRHLHFAIWSIPS